MTHLHDITALLIEDSLVDQTYVKAIVGRMPGITLYVAETWAVATRMMPIADLLIVDLNLPDVPTEQDAVENVVRLAPSMPVIVYSVTDSQHTIEQCELAGVVKFLRKDQTFSDELRDAVEEAASKTRRRALSDTVTTIAKHTNEINKST